MVMTEATDPPTGVAASSLEQLYRAEHHALVRLGYLLTGDQYAAEDLVHDAFAALQPRWGRLADPSRALGYVKVTMVNRSRSRYRRSVRELTRTPQQPSTRPGADEDVLEFEEQRRVVALVARLPRRQRQVVALRYWGQLTEAEIADALGISHGTVKSTASRALTALARLIDEETSR